MAIPKKPAPAEQIKTVHDDAVATANTKPAAPKAPPRDLEAEAAEARRRAEED